MYSNLYKLAFSALLDANERARRDFKPLSMECFDSHYRNILGTIRICAGLRTGKTTFIEDELISRTNSFAVVGTNIARSQYRNPERVIAIDSQPETSIARMFAAQDYGIVFFDDASFMHQGNRQLAINAIPRQCLVVLVG